MDTRIDRNKGGLLIGEVAHQAGLPASTLRYYESIGLLPEPRRKSGQRRYDGEVLQRLAVIDFARQCGFTIAEMQTLFKGFESSLPTPAAGHWKALARRKLTELETMINRARAMQQLLEQGLACECLELEECALIAARETGRSAGQQAALETCCGAAEEAR